MKGVLRTLAMLLVAGSLLAPAAGGVVHAQMTAPFGAAVGTTVSANDQGVGSHQVFVDSLAKNLGLSRDQLVNDVKSGMSLRDIAKAQGMDDKALAGAIRAATQDGLNEMVSRGRFTKDQAATYMDALNDISDTHLINVAEIMTAQVRMHMEKGGQGGQMGNGGQMGQGGQGR